MFMRKDFLLILVVIFIPILMGFIIIHYINTYINKDNKILQKIEDYLLLFISIISIGILLATSEAVLKIVALIVTILCWVIVFLRRIIRS